MNTDTEEQLDRPLFLHDKDMVLLEQQLYGHVLEAIDFEALGRFEGLLVGLLEGQEVPEDIAADLASAFLQRALERAASDPSRYMDFGPPLGITDAERLAVAFEADCPFCVDEAKRPGGPEREDECACCDLMASEWRKAHHDVLVKAGLAKAQNVS